MRQNPEVNLARRERRSDPPHPKWPRDLRLMHLEEVFDGFSSEKTWKLEVAVPQITLITNTLQEAEVSGP